MSTLPEVVGISCVNKSEEWHGGHIQRKLLKQEYADGSYAIIDGTSLERHMPDGGIKYYKASNNSDGVVLKHEKLADGRERDFYDSGKLKSESWPDGKKYEWYENEQMKSEEIPDKHLYCWHPNGQMSGKYLPNGEEYHWEKDGTLCYKKLADGSEYHSYTSFFDGKKEKTERLADGTYRSFNEKDELEYVKLPNGECFEYSEGEVVKHSYLDEKGRRIYDTRKYLAIKKVAERRVAKDEKLSQPSESNKKSAIGRRLSQGARSVKNFIEVAREIQQAKRNRK